MKLSISSASSIYQIDVGHVELLGQFIKPDGDEGKRIAFIYRIKTRISLDNQLLR